MASPRKASAQGFVFYNGSSTIDGKPVIAVATGLNTASSNSKTGPLVQIYILRADLSPLQAAQEGADISICGSCRHRGTVQAGEDGTPRNVGRSCYVTLIHGPSMVWRSFHGGSYATFTLEGARRALAGRRIRVGAYGDPGAIPFEVWSTVLDKADQVTSYTHLWKQFPLMSAFCMASCDSEDERTLAKSLGFRTFRVRGRNDPVMKGEGRCPASEEIGKAVTCSTCMLCDGQKRSLKSDITIIVHGNRAKHFTPAMG